MSTVIDKIAIYYPRALHDADGDANSLWYWAESFRRAGLSVEVLYNEARPVRRTNLPNSEIALRPVPHCGKGRLEAPRDLCRDLAPSTLLMIRSAYVLFNIAAGESARRNGIPYVVTPMGGYDPHIRITRRGTRRVWEVAERRLLRNARAVHVYFQAEVDHIRQLVPRARTIVAPTGYAMPDLQWRPQLEEPYVAWLGRYDIRHKGLDLLLDGMALLPTSKRPHLVLRGRDHKDSRTVVQQLVDDRGLTEHVSVGGPIAGTEKQEFLLGASAFVHPARWESYGIAVVENLAFGVPCLTTAGINLAPELRAARAARVVEASAKGLADGLAEAAVGELAEFGPRGRAFVREHLSPETAAQKFLDGLDDLRTTGAPR